MKIGVQYYPEHWPEERWQQDAKMMQDAGVQVVRMGEFAWSAFEPAEGQLDFSWMDRAIQILADHDIKTILCTCSRTPPLWVYHKYPSVKPVRQDGTILSQDRRYQVAHLHDDFVTLSQRIDKEVVEHFAGNSNILAWQIDNEVGSENDCFCQKCLKSFIEYLQKIFPSVEELNAAWGTHFWGFTLQAFEEMPIAKSHPQLVLAYSKFISHINTEFARWRSDMIRETDPGKQITTNFQNLYASHTDCHDVAKVIDVNGMNHYPIRTPELALDYYRGSRGEVWAMEQHTRLQTMETPQGMMRLWAWMACAHGASLVVYFRWRQCRWGAEQHADGILPHAGQENRFYHELKKIGTEVKAIGERISRTKPEARAAIIYSYASRWAIQPSRYPSKVLEPILEATSFHKALSHHVTAIDALDPHEDLSKYELVIAPRLWVVDEKISQNLKKYVENGGTLCLTVGSGVADEHGKSFDTPRPGLLHEMAGITVSDLAYDEALELKLKSSEIPALDDATASTFVDEIHLHGASVVAQHETGWRKGTPAITSNAFGKGRVIYIGAGLPTEGVEAVTNWICKSTGIQSEYHLPEHVTAYERVGEKDRLLFLLNWGPEAVEIKIGNGWKDAFSQTVTQDVLIPPQDLRILCKDAG